MTSRLRVLSLAVLCAASVIAASKAQAQFHQRTLHSSPERTISYMVGIEYVDDGYESDSLARPWSIRLASPIVGRFIVAEFAVGGVSTKTPLGVREHFVIPEGQVQLQIPAGPFMPYIGLGGGYVIGHQSTGAVIEGDTPMATWSLGLRTFLAGDKLTLNLEGRGRRYGSQADHRMGGEITGGIGIRF
jgi:opacity protein-like surface antigen